MDQDNTDNMPRDYQKLLVYLYATDQGNNDNTSRDYQDRGNRSQAASRYCHLDAAVGTSSSTGRRG